MAFGQIVVVRLSLSTPISPESASLSPDSIYLTACPPTQRDSNPMATATTATRICTTCATTKPLTEFRCRSRASSNRFGQCRTCHNAAERQRRATRKAEHNSRLMGRHIACLKNRDKDEDVRLIYKAMLDQFGGLRGLVAAWMDYYEQERKKGGVGAGTSWFQVIWPVGLKCRFGRQMTS